ncbi:MAG: trypsin-like peptidase domain-containing protein, partial [Alphaproteobacteria bacterium]|nr:trypsin-like peptidase domain-containing protein [Alphaproteobacteria bacterium]
TQASPVDPALHHSGVATGFFVGAAAWVLTNYHVVDDCKAVSIETPGGVSEAATLAQVSQEDDLALLKGHTPSPAVAAFRRGVDIDGQTVAVIGYPNLGLPTIKPQYVPGFLTGPWIADGSRFSFEAEVHPGNSGGPLLDQEGMVVGVVFAKINTPKVFEKTGKTVRNVAFAITPAVAARFLAGHGVTPVWAAETPPRLDDAALFAYAQTILTRVICWK